MKSSLTIVVFLTLFLLLSNKGVALDCLDLRILPLYQVNSLVFEGMIAHADPGSGTGRRERFFSFLAPSAAKEEIELRVNSASMALTLDENGAFAATFPRLLTKGKVELYDVVKKRTFYQREFSVPASPSYLVISDIDDTIMISDVPHKLRLVLKTLFRSVKGRKPVPGTPELYKALNVPRGKAGPPLFIYLSASPSTLARFLTAFIQRNKFPEGILCLKRSLQTEGLKPREHKIKWLNRLSSLYPGLPILLFGDAGETDPEIYADFLETSTVKCSGVIIRLLSPGYDEARLNPIQERLKKKTIPFFLWHQDDDLKKALERIGLITP